MSAHITTTTELTCHPTDLTVGVLLDLIAGHDRAERVRVRTASADRPGEMSTVTLTLIHMERS